MAAVVLTSAIALAGHLPASAAAAPDAFFGTLFDDNSKLTREQRGLDMDRQLDAGLGIVRLHVFWDQIEYEWSPGVQTGKYDWQALDAIVGDAADRGLRILPVVFSTPAFYKPAGAPTNVQVPPENPYHLGRFMRDMVERYRPFGSFWRQSGRCESRVDCEGPHLPITSWQIWNEPNYPTWWSGSHDPDPQEYVELLQQVYWQVKTIEPAAELVMGGLAPLTGSGTRTDYRTYLTEFYAANGAAFVDALAIHAYGNGVPEAASHVRAVRDLADEHLDTQRPIWITEYGWATAGLRSAFIKTLDCQAALIHAAAVEWRRVRDDLKLRGAIQFQWRDVATTSTAWPFHAGLNPADFQAPPKPALAQLARAIASQPPSPAYTVEAACGAPPGSSAAGAAAMGVAGTLPRTSSSSPRRTRDDVAPRLSGYRIAPFAFRAWWRGPSLRAVRIGHPARRPGARVTYRVTEAARTTFAVQRRAAGRRAGSRCVAPTRRNRRGRRCTRYVTQRGGFAHTTRRGRNAVLFTGRLAGRRLAPGLYRLVAVARDRSGNRSRQHRRPFRILR